MSLIFKNIVWLSLAEICYRLALFVLTIFIARNLGVGDYGVFQFALGFASLFLVFSDFGISDITLREFSKEKRREKDYSALLSLKLLLAVGTFSIIVLGSLFVTHDIFIRKIIWILALFVVLNSLFSILFAFFQAREQMYYKTIIRGLHTLILLFFGAVTFIRFPSIENLSIGYVFSTLAALVIIFSWFHLKVQAVRLRWDAVLWWQYFKMAWPIGGAAFFGGIFVYSDSVMLGYFGQIIQNGWYNAAYQLIGVTIIPSILIAIAFVPSLSRASPQELGRIWMKFFSLMSVLALVVLVSGFLLGSKAILLMYGPEFEPGIFAFKILIFMGFFNFLYIPFSTVLVASGMQFKYFLLQLGAAVLNIVLNLLMIPSLSLYGAALATVITYGILLLFGIILALRFTSIRFTLKLK
jgi:O-antigen/teichoic acid export membrane protein